MTLASGYTYAENTIEIYVQSRLNNPNFFNPEPLQTDSKSPITEFLSVN